MPAVCNGVRGSQVIDLLKDFARSSDAFRQEYSYFLFPLGYTYTLFNITSGMLELKETNCASVSHYGWPTYYRWYYGSASDRQLVGTAGCRKRSRILKPVTIMQGVKLISCEVSLSPLVGTTYVRLHKRYVYHLLTKIGTSSNVY